MKISLITVCYNSDKTIEKTIQSVINQKFINLEYIIIDGCSNDNTMHIINKYKKFIDKIISEPDKGLYDAINKGINISTGDIVGILNSDDSFYNFKVLNTISNLFISSPEIDIIFADVIFVNKNNNITRIYSSKNWKNFKFFFGFMPAHPTFYCKRSLFLKYGKYDTKYRIAADFELLFRFIYKHKIQYKYYKSIFVKMLVGGKSNSGIRSMVTINIETHRAIKTNGSSSFYLLFLVKYFIKIFELILIKRKLKNYY